MITDMIVYDIIVHLIYNILKNLFIGYSLNFD